MENRTIPCISGQGVSGTLLQNSAGGKLNKGGGNSTGGVRGRRRREGPGNLFGEGTRESESF